MLQSAEVKVSIATTSARKLSPGAMETRSQMRHVTFEEDKTSGKSLFEHGKASVMVKSLHNAGLLILFQHGTLSILVFRALGS